MSKESSFTEQIARWGGPPGPRRPRRPAFLAQWRSRTRGSGADGASAPPPIMQRPSASRH